MKKIIRKIFYKCIPELHLLKNIRLLRLIENSTIDKTVKLYDPCDISNTVIDAYTYIADNGHVLNTKIGKFCSIGPNLMCGWGIHPVNGISSSPMFYSTLKQNGFTFSKENKIKEWMDITIGNDVFIGMNVTILDGANIGDGAVIGAGAVVVDDIPPYAIAVGVPAKVVKYRFDEVTIQKLLQIKWWNDLSDENLADVEKNFFDIEKFIQLKLKSAK